MKKAVITTCIGLGLVLGIGLVTIRAAAQENQTATTKQAGPWSNLSPAERAAKQAAFRERINRTTGGLVRRTDVQNGRIVFANAQGVVPAADITKTVANLGGLMRIDMEVRPAAKGIDVKNTPAYLKAQSANVVIYLVEQGEATPALLVAPEERWAIVNVSKLAGDKAAARVQKELLRAFAYLCGGIGGQAPNRMTGAVTGLRDLDAIPESFLPIEIIGRCATYLSELGVKPYTVATYRAACRQGWAPAPTNDIQKAIWEQVKAQREAGPSNPIKIEYKK